MAFQIESFKAKLTKGGARPTLFAVQIVAPGTLNVGLREAPFFVRAANLPAVNIGEIQVPWMGRRIKYAGDKTFEDWTVSVLNDENFNLRDAIENWNIAINSHTDNVPTSPVNADPSSYKKNATIVQYGKAGDVIRSYYFEGLWPKSVGAITVSADSTDQIETFDVTFAYDYWTPGNKSDLLANA